MSKCGIIGIDCEWCEHKKECLSCTDDLNSKLKDHIHNTWRHNNPEKAIIEDINKHWKLKTDEIINEISNKLKTHSLDDFYCNNEKFITHNDKYVALNYSSLLNDEDNYGIFVPFVCSRFPERGLCFNPIDYIEDKLCEQFGFTRVTFYKSPINMTLDSTKLNCLIFIKP